MSRHQHGGNVAAVAARFGIDPGAFTDFSVNTNPLGPPAEVAHLLREAAALAAAYPDPDYRALRGAAAAFYGVDADRVIAGNGAVELIYLVAQVLQPHTVLIPAPTFKEYELVSRLCQARVKHFYLDPRRDFIPRLPQLIRAVRGVDLVFLCNPNNPTGTRLPVAVLKPFLRHCLKRRVFLVVDESFLLFHPNWRQLTCIPEAASGGILVLQSLTKFFAVPGLRIGCGIGSPEIIARLSSRQPPWHVNALAEAAARVAFQAGDYARQTMDLVIPERLWLSRSLLELRLVRRVFPSAANFLLLELQPPATAPALWEQLARRGVLVRDCSNFAFLGDRFIRVAVRDRERNSLLLEQLKQLDTASI
jgi:threonine-phosphate decarboxylase